MEGDDTVHTKRNALIVLICGVVLLALGFGLPIVAMQGADPAATGIIGGADAPTYQFLLFNIFDGLMPVLVAFGISIVISSGFCLVFSKTVMKHCGIRTSAISLGLSCVGGAGLVCFMVWFFAEASKHPIEYPASMAGGLACLGVFSILIVLYFKTREEKCTAIGVVIDVLTSIVYLPAFFWLFTWLAEILSSS